MRTKYNILYVDDEQDNLFVFQSLFRRFYNVYTASGGHEAIELLKSQQVDLVLSDQLMPRMTGVELCQYITKEYPDSVRMIVTGYSEMEPIFDAIKAGMVKKCITKPWKMEELKTTIETALNPTA